MSTYAEIEEHQLALESARRTYLQRHGWKETSNMPGSYWLWVRDFADLDAKRQARHPATASSFRPYGVVTAETGLAVKMTRSELDGDPEEDVEE